MRRTFALASFSLLSVAALAACSKDSTQPMEAVDAPPFGGAETFTVDWGPVTVPAGKEDTQCVWAKLANTAEIKVHTLHNVLSTGSHHVIVYKDDDDAHDAAKVGAAPVPCQPFTGALNSTGMIFPMMITQKIDDTLTLPDGVAYTLKPGQLIKVEMHYINTGEAPVAIDAHVNLINADPATIHDEANLLFIGSPDINIGAGSPDQPKAAELHQFFDVSKASLDLSKAKFFAITGHEHSQGTNVQVNFGPKGGTMTPIYNPTNFLWSEPVTQNASPPFTLAAGDGFDFTCDWANKTTSPIQFGEKTTNEMCFFWAYYYPSNGSHVCVHSDQFQLNGDNTGADVCCPDNSALCGLIAQQFGGN